MPAKTKASFIEPMLLLRAEKLPSTPQLIFELKLDGYRAIAFKSGGKIHLRSRNGKDFAGRYPSIANVLSSLPDETVIDGEIVALDERGRPSFNVLQNHASSTQPLLYYVSDVMMLSGKNVMGEPLEHRREL